MADQKKFYKIEYRKKVMERSNGENEDVTPDSEVVECDGMNNQGDTILFFNHSQVVNPSNGQIQSTVSLVLHWSDIASIRLVEKPSIVH